MLQPFFQIWFKIPKEKILQRELRDRNQAIMSVVCIMGRC